MSEPRHPRPPQDDAASAHASGSERGGARGGEGERERDPGGQPGAGGPGRPSDASSGPASDRERVEGAHALEHGDETRVVEVDGRRFVLVGTAHVSRESADLVRRVIEAERPDCVCIELDPARYEALSRPEVFEQLDLREVIRRRQLVTLLLNLVLVSYQRQLGGKLGVQPGAELLEAARAAEREGIPIALCDREVRLTLRRAWAALGLWRKLRLVVSLVASLFERPELGEEELRRLRQQDAVTALMEELGAAFPALKEVLIDERDAYLAERIRRARGERIVAVVGAGHVDGIRTALAERRRADLEALEVVPPRGRLGRALGWGVPAAIVAALVAIGLRHGAEVAGASVRYWVLANGIPCGIGAVLALAHPLTVAVAALAAPITSLTPVIGAGYVAAFVQAWLRPPRIFEIRSVAADLRSPRRWWTNRLLKVLLVFLLTTLGSALGTFAGGFEIARRVM